MAKTIECFYPGDAFPAISVTGNKCALDCKHCSKKYLDGMIPATTPEELIQVAEALAERGAKGFLLSGGSDSLGRVRVAEFAEAISEVKSTTDLTVNAHVGLSKYDDLRRLTRAGVDAFSTDMYGDSETISDVLGINARPDDYLQVVKDLKDAGAKRIAPHVCIGIRGGRLGGEVEAIRRLAPLSPDVLILISLMPTKGTAYANVRPPERDMMVKIVAQAREVLPGSKLLLGCMRSKLDRSAEFDVVEAGADGIVLPSSGTVEKLTQRGYSVRKRSSCCALI